MQNIIKLWVRAETLPLLPKILIAGVINTFIVGSIYFLN